MNNKHWFARCLIASATSLALAAPLAAGAAVDMFLKIDGIQGEAIAKGHEKEIDVLSWSWGVSRGAADALARTKPSACVSDMHFAKLFDAASPSLMANVVSGMTIPGATLAVRKAGVVGGGQDYLIIVMKDIIVTSVQDSGSSGDVPLETIALRFSSAKVTYKMQKPDGSFGNAIETTISSSKAGC